MSLLLLKGIIRNGRVEVAELIDLPDGSEVTITAPANGKAHDPTDHDRTPTASEIAETLAAMSKIEPFDMTNEERSAADTWEKVVNEYTIATLDKGIEDTFR